MSIVVYKTGKKDIVDGVECDIVVVETVEQMESLIKEGCVHDPKELSKPKAKLNEKHKGGSDQ